MANSPPPVSNGTDMAVARKKRARRFTIFGIVLAVALVLGGIYWWTGRNGRIDR